MGSVMIGNFGIDEGIQTFRICGAKIDLEKLIEECIEMDAPLESFPMITHVHRQQFTMLLKIRVYEEVD
jgi:hypothetical protein